MELHFTILTTEFFPPIGPRVVGAQHRQKWYRTPTDVPQLPPYVPFFRTFFGK